MFQIDNKTKIELHDFYCIQIILHLSKLTEWEYYIVNVVSLTENKCAIDHHLGILICLGRKNPLDESFKKKTSHNQWKTNVNKYPINTTGRYVLKIQIKAGNLYAKHAFWLLWICSAECGRLFSMLKAID